MSFQSTCPLVFLLAGLGMHNFQSGDLTIFSQFLQLLEMGLLDKLFRLGTSKPHYQ
jgi:hypothetical protein